MELSDRYRSLIQRADKVLPGPQSNLRAPVAIAPTFLTRGEGSRLWDIDGTGYIDYMIAAGPGILGHSNPAWLDAIHRQLDRLYYSVSGASQTPLEVELAEKMVAHAPGADRVRFCLSGTEAVQLAIRLARGFTGRRIFIRFEGSYHGWMDNVLGGAVSADPVEHPWPEESETDPLGTLGRDPAAFEQCFRVPWNDIDLLEAVLDRWAGEVAMLLIEPVQGSGCFGPRPGYLERVRELCDRHGTVMCFDEVVTGFRLGLGGAAEAFGVTPDLSIFGKAMAAGLPISAVAGRAEIMDQLRDNRVVGAGTFNGYPLGVAAALETIRILEADDGAWFRRVDEAQTRLMAGLREIGSRLGLAMNVHGFRGMFIIHFTEPDREIYSLRDLAGVDPATANRLRVLLAEEGVLIMWGGRWYVTGAHTPEVIDDTLDRTERVLKRL